VLNLSNVKQIAAGSYNPYAVRDDGTVWAWGPNWSGLLGDGTTTDRLVPTQVVGLTGVDQITANPFAVYAVRDDGTVWAWGYNFDEELGDGTGQFKQLTPVPVVGLTNIARVVGGETMAFAISR
jgi:alpha-tubulin suppressor-like RCC1 family protein